MPSGIWNVASTVTLPSGMTNVYSVSFTFVVEMDVLPFFTVSVFNWAMPLAITVKVIVSPASAKFLSAFTAPSVISSDMEMVYATVSVL